MTIFYLFLFIFSPQGNAHYSRALCPSVFGVVAHGYCSTVEQNIHTYMDCSILSRKDGKA